MSAHQGGAEEGGLVRRGAPRGAAWWRGAAAVLLLAIGPAAARANARLPVRAELPPGSAIFSPGRDLVVEHEALRLDCAAAGCEVSATYRIRSSQDATLAIRFLAPSPVAREARVNDAPAALTVTALAEQAGRGERASHRVRMGDGEVDFTHGLKRPACREPPRLEEPAERERYVACQLEGNLLGADWLPLRAPWGLYELGFAAPVRAGLNTLTVRYQQPWSTEELLVRSFPFGPDLAEQVSYELWPLKGWQLDPAFTLDLTVRLENPRHGLLWRLRRGLVVRGGSLAVAAAPGGRLGALAPVAAAATPVQQGGALVFQATLGRDFPDRLFVVAGEEEALRSLRESW